jgi:tetratricopeptide (TPR) repeat protein
MIPVFRLRPVSFQARDDILKKRYLRHTCTALLLFCPLVLGLVSGPATAQDEDLTAEEKIASLNNTLMLNPADANAWNDLGLIYAEQEKFDLARDAFIKAVQCAPTNADYHRNLGAAFSRLGMYDMAANEYQAYQRLDTIGAKDYWRLIAFAQRKAGQLDAARATYAEGLAVLGEPANYEGMRLVLGLHELEKEAGNDQARRKVLAEYAAGALKFLHAQLEKDAEGAEEARTIVQLRVNEMVADAQVLEDSGMLGEAGDMYSEAYEMTPDRDDLLPRMVEVYLKNGDSMKARVTARLARDESPERAGTWIASGKVYEATRRLEDAVAAYEKAFALEQISDLAVAIGNLHMRLGNNQEAARWLSNSVSIDNTKPEVVYNYAVSQIREKKYHAAIASLRSVVRQRPEMVPAWSALAQCLRATKQYGAAIEPYQKVLEKAPEPKTAYNLGYCAMRAKRYNTAIEAYQKALELDPTMVEARYNLSLTFRRAGRSQEAVDSFEAMKELEPDSYRVLFWQGQSYYDLGQYDQALENYDQALELKETVEVYNEIRRVYLDLDDKKEAAKIYKTIQAMQGGK